MKGKERISFSKKLELILIYPENTYHMALLVGGKNKSPLEPFAIGPCPFLYPPSLSGCWSYLLLLGGVRGPLFLLTPAFTVLLLRPRLLRTRFSIQALRLVRLLCSDSTIRGHGLHSAMSRAAMAIARPTCRRVIWLSIFVL